MSIDAGRNVKVIVLENAEITPRPDLVGQWLDERHYHTLVQSDMDLYLPPKCATELGTEDCDKACGGCQKALNEQNIVFKFRKNYFSPEMTKSAYEGLRDAAQETQNRGTAAGPRGEKLLGRDWVTAYQWDIIQAFQKSANNLLGEDPIEAIKAKYADNRDQASNRAQVWLRDSIADANFQFDDWVEKCRRMPANVAADEAHWVEDELISKTTYANPVNSGIAGWYDRYPRIPYGPATSYTEKNFEKFKKSYPYLKELSKAFSELLPWRYGNQKAAADKIDPRFLVPDTPFSTITVNRNFRTAAHYDPANMENGFANICVFSNIPEGYRGAYLVFPEIGYAVDVRPGDLLFVNNMAGLHGNTELFLDDPAAERISIIAFFHEGMLTLGSKEYEDARKKYVDFCKNDVNNPHYRPRFNGVYPGMWDSQEWFEFCEKEVGRAELLKMHPDAEKSSLDEFFA